MCDKDHPRREASRRGIESELSGMEVAMSCKDRSNNWQVECAWGSGELSGSRGQVKGVQDAFGEMFDYRVG